MTMMMHCHVTAGQLVVGGQPGFRAAAVPGHRLTGTRSLALATTTSDAVAPKLGASGQPARGITRRCEMQQTAVSVPAEPTRAAIARVQGNSVGAGLVAPTLVGPVLTRPRHRFV
jgi:hypothetical protein